MEKDLKNDIADELIDYVKQEEQIPVRESRVGGMNEKRRLLEKLALLMDEVESMIGNDSVTIKDLVYIYDQLSEIYTLVLTFFKGEGGEEKWFG